MNQDIINKVNEVFASRDNDAREVVFVAETDITGKTLKAGQKGHFDKEMTTALLSQGLAIFSSEYVPEPKSKKVSTSKK
jgi:hypothetical protein